MKHIVNKEGTAANCGAALSKERLDNTKSRWSVLAKERCQEPGCKEYWPKQFKIALCA